MHNWNGAGYSRNNGVNRIAPSRKPVKVTLQPVVPQEDLPDRRRHRVLVRMPTRSRPDQALSVLKEYRRLAGMPIDLEVVVDADDASMTSCETVQRLHDLGCLLTVGRHTSKVQAVNGGRVKDWDILVLASDDMVPVVDGYAVKISAAMQAQFPYLDGALHFNDGAMGSTLCTLPVIGRRFYEQFGFVYEPSYLSLYCDQEQTELWQAMGRLAYVPETLIEHRHPYLGKASRDGLYLRNDSLGAIDRATYERRVTMRREMAQWGFDSPALHLTVAIATQPSRKHLLDRLVDELYRQITKDRPRQAEVIVEAVGNTTGEKRQKALDKAHGRFIAFVDDDDWVAHDYIERVVGAIERNGEADCVSLEGVMTTDGAGPEVFKHSVAYSDWRTENGIHLRCPNHLNAVRTDLARKAGFRAMTIGEDRDYSLRLRPLLKVEADAGREPLYFYWFKTNKNYATTSVLDTHALIATVPWRRASCERLLREISAQTLKPSKVHLVLDGYGDGDPSPAVPPGLTVVEHRFAQARGPGNRWLVAERLDLAPDLIVSLDDDVSIGTSFVEMLVGKTSGATIVAGCGGRLGNEYLASPRRKFDDVHTDYLEAGAIAIPWEFLQGISSYGSIGERALGLKGHDEALLSAHLWKTGRGMLLTCVPYKFDASAEDPRSLAHSRDAHPIELEIKKAFGWRCG